MNIKGLATEVSYKDGMLVSYGTKDSIRFDAILCDETGMPIMAWDYKTGSAVLSQSRINLMLRKSGIIIPIEELR